MTKIDNLFDKNVELFPFEQKSLIEIPVYGSIIYTVFLDKTEFIYVGIGGLSGKSVKDRNPKGRIRQHIQGRRSGDQFCIYIQDFYVIPSILNSNYLPEKGYLDKLTKEFIQSRLSFRFLVIQTEDSYKVVRRLEKEIQSGTYKNMVPFLNGIK